jgi:hypothetical protein
VVPDTSALAIDALVKFTEVNVEFLTVAPVITILDIVAPAKVVPVTTALAIDAPVKFTEVIVEFVTVALVITAFTRDAPTNEVPDTVVPDNEAPLISTLSYTFELVIVAPCNAEPASDTVITQETLGGALYNDDDACDTTTVAVPGPFSVTTPVEELTVSTLLELGSLNA